MADQNIIIKFEGTAFELTYNPNGIVVQAPISNNTETLQLI